MWVKLDYCDILQKEVDKALEGIFEKEERFMPHLTIARVKSVNNKEALSVFLEKNKK